MSDLFVLENYLKMEKLGISADDLTSEEYHNLIFYGVIPDRYEMEKDGK